MLLRQGPSKSSQMALNTSKNVTEGASTCSSQVTCLLMPCVCYDTSGVALATTGGSCYGSDSSLFSQYNLKQLYYLKSP